VGVSAYDGGRPLRPSHHAGGKIPVRRALRALSKHCFQYVFRKYQALPYNRMNLADPPCYASATRQSLFNAPLATGLPLLDQQTLTLRPH
jgi:hypothetical protein